jgi:multidrug transporter EmrE-like cation transporter
MTARDFEASMQQDWMHSVRYALLALAVAFNVGSYVLFKYISAKPHGLAWAGLFACGLAFGAINVFLFTTALRELKLAIAYPVFSGASITAIVLLSAWLFDESVTRTNFAGAVLVALGIGLLSR